MGLPVQMSAEERANKYAQEIKSLRARVAELEEAFKDLFAMMDEGLLVRDTTNDAKPNFAIRQIPFVRRLAKVRAALDGDGGKDEQG